MKHETKNLVSILYKDEYGSVASCFLHMWGEK